MATIELLRNFQWEKIDFHIGMGYFLDALSFKFYQIEYPQYCVIDIASIVFKADYIECGYKKDRLRVAPLHAMDPNINYSFIRYFLPNIYGYHSVKKITMSDILFFLENGVVYSK